MALCALLGACAPNLAAFKPIVYPTTDADTITPALQDAIDRDTTVCKRRAAKDKPTFDLGKIGTSTGDGVLKSGTSAAASANPASAVAILLAGGAGEGGSEALDESGLTNTAEIAEFLICMDNHARRSGEYEVDDYNLMRR